MATPMRAAGGAAGCGGGAGWGPAGAPRRGGRRVAGRGPVVAPWCLRKGGGTGRSRGGPPGESNAGEAGDERSRPQDVTSPWVRHGGANLQPEVEPQQTERPPRDSSLRG